MRSTNIILFLLALNGAALVMSQLLGPAMGVSVTVGGDAAIDDTLAANESFNDIQRTGVDEFISATFSVVEFLGLVQTLVFAGPEMLENLGVPSLLTNSFKALVVFIVTVDIAEVLSGRVVS